MSKSDQIAGSKQSQSSWTKKQSKKGKKTATFGWETDIMGVPIIPYPESGPYPPVSRDDEYDLEIPKVPKPEVIASKNKKKSSKRS